MAIGIASICNLEEEDRTDLFGNQQRTGINLVDEIAGAAAMVMGEADENRPVVIIRGVRYTRGDSAAIRRWLIRTA